MVSGCVSEWQDYMRFAPQRGVPILRDRLWKAAGQTDRVPCIECLWCTVIELRFNRFRLTSR